MCVKDNTIIYVARASNSKRDCEHDLYCCLLPQCEALRTCCSGFPIATLLSTTSALWFWRRIRFVVHFRDEFLSFLCCETSCFKNNFSFFNQYFRIFSGILHDQRPISLPPDRAGPSRCGAQCKT